MDWKYRIMNTLEIPLAFLGRSRQSVSRRSYSGTKRGVVKASEEYFVSSSFGIGRYAILVQEET
jgi:hypothetical protein